MKRELSKKYKHLTAERSELRRAWKSTHLSQRPSRVGIDLMGDRCHISDAFDELENNPFSLRQFHGKQMLLTELKKYWPELERLRERRRLEFLRLEKILIKLD